MKLMFTDWSYGDVAYEVAQYFWARGALWGSVFATIVWLLVVPYLRRCWREINSKG